MLNNPVVRITKGELFAHLDSLSDDTEIDFGCTLLGVPLEFFRFKMRGDNLMCIELSEQFPTSGIYALTLNDDMSVRSQDTPYSRSK